MRVLRVLAMGIAFVLLSAVPAVAQLDDPEFDPDTGDDGIDVTVTGDGEDGHDDQCSDPIWWDTPKCKAQNGGPDGPTSDPALPDCIEDGAGGWANEPCNPPVAPCIAFPDPDVVDPCAADEPPPPPDPEVLAEEAFDDTPWPEIRLATGPGDTGVVYAMIPYSLVLDAPGWSWDTPISASASLRGLTVTVYAQPESVTWDTDAINSHPAPNLPDYRFVECQSNGQLTGAGGGRGYQGTLLPVGGPSCLTTWYASDSVLGGRLMELQANVKWRVWWVASDGQTSAANWREPETLYVRGDIEVQEVDSFYVSADYVADD